MGESWMFSRLHRPAQRADVNWAPLSDVMVAGTPNLVTQPAKRALAQSAAVMEASGEQVGVAVRGRQWPDQVDVDVGETAVRYRYLCWL